MREKFIVKEENYDFRRKYANEESFIGVHSSNIRQFVDYSSNQGKIFDGFVVVLNKQNGRKIVRRVISNNVPGLNGESIIICYRSRKYLDVKEGDTVFLRKACWFSYLWHHVDSAIRYPFQLAVAFGCLSIVGLLLTIYNLFCGSCCE